MRVLITGSRGQLARELQAELAGDGEILALGRDRLNLADTSALGAQIREIRPDLIVNTAAYTAVDKAESEPEAAFAVNAVAPGILAEEAERLGIPLIHYSTDYVFDGHKSTPYGEDDPTNPLNVYGRSKLAGEQAIQRVAGQSLILRTSWVYSQHGRNFLLTMQRLMQQSGRLRVVDDEIGAPTWAATLAKASAAIIRRWRDEGRELRGLYHLSAGGSTSWYGFARRIADHLAQQGRLQAELTRTGSADYPTAARRPLNSRLDCSRIARDWQIQLPDWDSALNHCLRSQSHCDNPPLACPAHSA